MWEGQGIDLKKEKDGRRQGRAFFIPFAELCGCLTKPSSKNTEDVNPRQLGFLSQTFFNVYYMLPNHAIKLQIFPFTYCSFWAKEIQKQRY